MEIVRTVAELRSWTSEQRKNGFSIGLVPTMGSVHSGHLSLVNIAYNYVDIVIASVFVNPLQFSPQEDFDQYPRDEIMDAKLFEAAGVKLLYIPNKDEVYCKGHSTTIHIGPLNDDLEGQFRPHFFVGVATVVTKLLIQVNPDAAIFGEKDFQQLCIIKKLVKDLDICIQIIGGKTVRESDGLAISSRNQYLSDQERILARELYAGMQSLNKHFQSLEEIDGACDDLKGSLLKAGFSAVDYLVIRHAESLERLVSPAKPMRILGAAWLGKTRLIDNLCF